MAQQVNTAAMQAAPEPATDGARLEALARLADGMDAPALAEQARALSDRVRQGLFYVAFVGQFKRGKSTLLNALLGRALLPVGVAPVTALVTLVRHGPEPGARIRLASGDWRKISVGELAEFVSEERNPGNAKGVSAVEVFAPSELLESGMCLVDTPGIGSVFDANTETTSDFVPHIDAAVAVLGADPPLSGDELSLVTRIVAQCENLIFVLNKADRLSGGDRREAVGFTRKVLAERAGLRDVAVFEVSAAERLAGRGPDRDWASLGAALTSLAVGSGSELVRAAEERGLASLTARLRSDLDERRGALVRPVEESEQRVEALRACVEEAEGMARDMSYLFAAEQDRLARVFGESKAQFLQRAIEPAREELTRACRALPTRRATTLRRRSVALAQQIAERALDGWLEQIEPEMEKLYARAMDRFVDLSNDFLAQLKASAGSTLAGLPDRVGPEIGFRWDSRLFYKDLFKTTGLGIGTWLVDLLRTRRSALRAIDERTGDYLLRLLATNTTRIENDLNERVLESRRRFEFELRSALRSLLASACRSLDRARELHCEGSQAVCGELAHLDALYGTLDAIGRGPAAPG